MRDTGIAGRLCELCHQVKETLIRCKNCGKLACLACFYTDEGLCADCIVDKFNEKYHDKIQKYARA